MFTCTLLIVLVFLFLVSVPAADEKSIKKWNVNFFFIRRDGTVLIHHFYSDHGIKLQDPSVFAVKDEQLTVRHCVVLTPRKIGKIR